MNPREVLRVLAGTLFRARLTREQHEALLSFDAWLAGRQLTYEALLGALATRERERARQGGDAERVLTETLADALSQASLAALALREL